MTDRVAIHDEDLPFPVLFNSWKHHAGAIRGHIRSIGQEGEAALNALPARLLIIGTELMDLYTGSLSPAQIAEQIVAGLRREARIEIEPYRLWLKDNGDYSVSTLEDGSRWVLRMGDEAGRYVHVHPGRWAPGTRRVRANVLKTAIMVLADTAVHGGDPCDVARINAVRIQYLGLSPIQTLSSGEGLAVVLRELL